MSELNRIIDSELRIGILENVVDLMMEKNSNIIKFTKEELDAIDSKVIERLQKKYPDEDVQLRSVSIFKTMKNNRIYELLMHIGSELCNFSHEWSDELKKEFNSVSSYLKHND